MGRPRDRPGLSALALVVLLGTGPQLGMVWDGGYTLGREQLLDRWVHRLLDPAPPGRTLVLVLALGLIGIATGLAGRRRQPWTVIWPLSWITLMIVRALPIAPGPDGVRLFLPSVASLAVLAGLGVAWLADRFGSGRGRLIARLIAAAALVECLVGTVGTDPCTDSSFNRAVGGLPGAERAGLELTSYGETIGPEFLAWTRATARGQTITLALPMGATNHPLLRQWGAVPPGVQFVDLNSPPEGPPKQPDSSVLQRRRGLDSPSAGWLERHGIPSSRSAARGSTGSGSIPPQRSGKPSARPGTSRCRASSSAEDRPEPSPRRIPRA